VDVQLAAVRLDAGAESLLIERLEVFGDGAHGVCDRGRPENSSPGVDGCHSVLAVETKWESVESGPADAEQTVLLLPGGMCSARSYAELMAESSLARTRLLAVTMPGHAGAAPPKDFSTESYAQITAELAKSAGVDLVVGFSMGAMVAYEMVVSGAFAGPVVLLGASLSAADEPRFFRAIIRLGSILGTLPFAVLKKGAASMVKHAPVPAERQAELQADFARNNTRDMRQGLQAYLRWLRRDDDPARRLCKAGVPAWVMHAEKGDGALTQHERAILEACPDVRVVTLPGRVFLLPNEVPERIAEVIVQALAEA
jgi:pimeloyl-ACP methyl ester carboxylesterase